MAQNSKKCILVCRYLSAYFSALTKKRKEKYPLFSPVQPDVSRKGLPKIIDSKTCLSRTSDSFIANLPIFSRQITAASARFVQYKEVKKKKSDFLKTITSAH